MDETTIWTPAPHDIADAISLLRIKDHQRPEGYSNFAGGGHVRLYLPLRDAMNLDDLDAWMVLLAAARAEAVAAVEERALQVEERALQVAP